MDAMDESCNPKAAPVAGVLLTALALLLAAGLLSFAGPCEAHPGASPNSCHWAMRVLLGLDAALGIISIVRIFETDEGERRGLSFAAGLLGVLMALTPGVLVDLCADPAMHCNALMRPFALCVGTAVAFVGGGDLAKRLLSLRNR